MDSRAGFRKLGGSPYWLGARTHCRLKGRLSVSWADGRFWRQSRGDNRKIHQQAFFAEKRAIRCGGWGRFWEKGGFSMSEPCLVGSAGYKENAWQGFLSNLLGKGACLSAKCCLGLERFAGERLGLRGGDPGVWKRKRLCQGKVFDTAPVSISNWLGARSVC